MMRGYKIQLGKYNYFVIAKSRHDAILEAIKGNYSSKFKTIGDKDNG